MACRASSVVRRTVKRSAYRRRKCEPPMQVTDAAVPAGAPLSRRRRRCDRDLAGAAAPPPTGPGLQRVARGGVPPVLAKRLFSGRAPPSRLLLLRPFRGALPGGLRLVDYSSTCVRALEDGAGTFGLHSWKRVMAPAD